MRLPPFLSQPTRDPAVMRTSAAMILAETPRPVRTLGGCASRSLIGPDGAMHAVAVDVGVVATPGIGGLCRSLMMGLPRHARG